MSDWWIFDVGGWRTVAAIFVHGAAGFIGFAIMGLLWDRVGRWIKQNPRP